MKGLYATVWVCPPPWRVALSVCELEGLETCCLSLPLSLSATGTAFDKWMVLDRVPRDPASWFAGDAPRVEAFFPKPGRAKDRQDPAIPGRLPAEPIWPEGWPEKNKDAHFKGSLSLTHTHTHTLSLSHTHTHTLSLSRQAFLAGGNADRAREVAVADLRAALAAQVSLLLLLLYSRYRSYKVLEP